MSREETERRRALQPLWNALDEHVAPLLEGGVLLCVSGGRDSSALLESVARWRARERGRVEVASVDHGLRREAPLEVEAVSARARALGFTEAHRLRATPVADDEAELRRARYDVLWSCARERGLGALCTAHHADDDAEGLLLDLLGLGGGREGAAMPAATKAEHGFLLRPFVELDAATLARALVAAGAPPPFVDPDDARGHNARARLRLTVWPALTAVAPRAKARFALKARRRLEDEAALSSYAAALLTFEGEDALVATSSAPAAVVRRAVHEAVRRLAPGVDARSAGPSVDELLRARPGARFDLPGCVAVVEEGGVRIHRRDRMGKADDADPAS